MALGAACGGGDDDGGDNSGASPLMALLGAIPDTPEAASYVGYSDLGAYYDALGVDSPPRGASNDEFDEWLGELSEAERGDFAPLLGGAEFALDALRDAEAFQAEIGLDPADIRQSIEAGAPPEMYTILRGGFDSGDIGDAVENDENFADLLETETHSDVNYYTWGEDFEQDFARNSPVHSLGRGGRLALHDDLLMWCFWTDGMTGMIDAAIDAAGSLADRPDVAAIADALQQADVFSAQVFGGLQTPAEFGAPSASATGAGMDAEGPALTLVFAYEDAAQAASNVATVEAGLDGIDEFEGRPWAERVDSIDVAGEGQVVVATLHGPDLPWNFLAQGGG